MRYDKLTAKFQQALAEAQSLALAADSSYLEAGFVLPPLNSFPFCLPLLLPLARPRGSIQLWVF